VRPFKRIGKGDEMGSAFTNDPIYNRNYQTNVSIRWTFKTTSPDELQEVQNQIAETVELLLNKIPERFQEIAAEDIEIETELS
jgi:hypothetical protein